MCGLRFSLPLLLSAMLGWSWSSVLAAHVLAPGENGHQKVNRLDSDQDPAMKVSIKIPYPVLTKLFASCIVPDSAYVRFRELRFPAKGVEFTRYVPIADQLAIYNTSWRVVNNSSLKTSIACASFAEKDPSAMMYQFNGSACLVSTVRMPMKSETCGDTNAKAVFIRTSCPEPTAQVTLTPAPGAMNISWITNDPCQLAVKFTINWVNVEDNNIEEVNNDVFQYRIADRLGCETQTVTISALDFFSQPYGNPMPVSNDTLPRGPPRMATLNIDRYVDHLDVNWTIADDECLRINEFVFEWKNTTLYSGSVKLNKNTYSRTITELHACLNITVSVKAHFDAGAGTTNVVTDTQETLPEDPVITTFVVDRTTYSSIEVSWTVLDYCNFIQGLKIIARETTSNRPIDLPKDARSMTDDALACDTQVTFDLIPINGVGEEFASRKSVSGSTTNPDAVVRGLLNNVLLFFDVAFQWNLDDHCNKATKVKIEINERPPTFQDDTDTSYGADSFACGTTVVIRVTPVNDETSATPVGDEATLSVVTLNPIPSFDNIPWQLPDTAPPDLTLSWAVKDNQCGYITGYTISYGSDQTQSITDPRATSATISGYNACDLQSVTIDMLGGTDVISSVSSRRTAPMLSANSVELGFRKAKVSWSYLDACNLIHHHKLTFAGGEVVTQDRTPSATITNRQECHDFSVTVDGVDISDASVVQETISDSPTTESSCNGEAVAEDVCYACLHYLTVLPKRNKADSATKCTGMNFALYRPADAAEVAEIIVFLASELVPAADYADFRLYVDLTLDNGKWTWGGPAAVDETSSSNWAPGHPKNNIGNCAIMSGGEGFKLVSVDCDSGQFAMCIEYI